jgi:glycosyltransferase involved in cell wall biosynthesis
VLSLSDLLTDLPTLPEVDPSLWFAVSLAAILVVIAIKARLNERSLPELEPQEPGEQPLDCMVVIPARNEAGTIARAVKSLPHDTVIVVDDASEDQTAEVAKSAGAGVIVAPKLLRGMLGKTNACAEGARLLTTKWILFADADTWYEPGFLESAIGAAEAAKVDFFSIYLQPAYETWSARVMAPYASALYFFAVNPRADIARAFNGQCVLVKREPYEFVGGHGAIHSLNEDQKLAALAMRHRMKMGLGRTSILGHVRTDLEPLQRNAQRFIPGETWAGARVLLAALAFFLWIPSVAWLLMDGHRMAAAAFAIFPILILSSWYGAALAILAPFGILLLTPKLVAAAIHVILGRRTKWKGRYILSK